jgi:hypothetical protein
MNLPTNIYPFLKVVPHLNSISGQSIIKLSKRFKISTETLSLLIHIATNGGAISEN